MNDPSRPERPAQNEAVRANYRREEVEKNSRAENRLHLNPQTRTPLGHEAASLNTTCDMSSHLD